MVARRLLACVGMTLLLLGCGGGGDGGTGGPGEPPPGPSHPRTEHPRTEHPPTEHPRTEHPRTELAAPVTLHIGGGEAGISQGIEVARDGAVHVADEDERRPARPLGKAELTDLAAGLAEVDFAALPARSVDEQAADMFQYRLEYRGHALLTDRTEPLGPVDEVIDLLASSLDART
jgi:hypothetical protein